MILSILNVYSIQMFINLEIERYSNDKIKQKDKI